MNCIKSLSNHFSHWIHHTAKKKHNMLTEQTKRLTLITTEEKNKPFCYKHLCEPVYSGPVSEYTPWYKICYSQSYSTTKEHNGHEYVHSQNKYVVWREREKERDRERESNRVKTWQTLKYLPLQCTCVIIIHIGKHKICLYTQAQDHSWPQKTSTTYMQKVQKLKNYYFCVTKFKYGDLEDAISYRNSHQNMTWLCKENTLHGCPTLLSQYTTLFHRTETIRLLFSPRIIYSHS